MNEETSKKRHIVYLLILALFCVVMTLVNYLWVSLDRSPPYCGHLVYLVMSREYMEILLRGEFFDFLINTGNFYPPLPFQISALFYLIFGYGGVQAVMSHAVFPVILVFSTFYLGSYLWNDDVGFASALICASIPQNVYLMRYAGVDIPILAMLPLCLYCLFRSDRFKNSRWSILFFVTLAVGMLLKWVFIIFILIPAGFYILLTLKNNLKDRESRGETIIFLVVLAAGAGVYYLTLIYAHRMAPEVDMASLIETYYLTFLGVMTAIFLLLQFVVRFRSGEKRNIARGIVIFLAMTAHFVVIHLIPMKDIYDIWFWDVQYNLLLPVRTTYYFFVKFFIYANFGIPYFILFIIGIIIYFLSRNKTPEKTVLITSVLFSVVFLYTQPVFDSRYFIPLNPVAAMFMAFWIFSIKRWFLRLPVFILMGVLAVYYFFGWAFIPSRVIAMEERLGRVTGKPYGGIYAVDEAAKTMLEIYRKETPEKGMLIVVEDDCSEIMITPLLFLYHLRNDRKADEMAAMLYRGADPIFAEKSEAWGFFIGKNEDEKDDDRQGGYYSKDVEKEKPGRVGEKETNSLNRLESSEINMVDAGTVYFCRFRDYTAEKRFPVKLLDKLKEKPEKSSISEEPAGSIRVLEGTVMDFYRIKKGVPEFN